jgi:hypothetical protein
MSLASINVPTASSSANSTSAAPTLFYDQMVAKNVCCMAENFILQNHCNAGKLNIPTDEPILVGNF